MRHTPPETDRMPLPDLPVVGVPPASRGCKDVPCIRRLEQAQTRTDTGLDTPRVCQHEGRRDKPLQNNLPPLGLGSTEMSRQTHKCAPGLRLETQACYATLRYCTAAPFRFGSVSSGMVGSGPVQHGTVSYNPAFSYSFQDQIMP